MGAGYFIRCKIIGEIIKLNYKIIILIFGIFNIALFFLSAKTLKFVFKNTEKEKNINLPVIEPLKENIKEKPDEVELFPHSDSSIWKEFKKNRETMDNKIIESSNLEANRENNNIDQKDMLD